MKIIMDGSKLVSMIRYDDGFHLYFQERDPALPEDKIIPKRKEDFNPNPIVEVVMPKNRTPILFAASILMFLTHDEFFEVIKEYHSGKSRGKNL